MNGTYNTCDENFARAARLHELALVVDTHCDTTQRLMADDWNFGERHADGHLDIPRLREGGVNAIFLAVFVPSPATAGAAIAGAVSTAARAQFERISETIRRHDEDLMLARTADDVRRAKAEGRIAVLPAVEGGHLIEDSLDELCEYHQRGAAYLTLTHGSHTNWADSSGIHDELAPRHGGLTAFGRDVVRELNRLGMMVDVSHVSDAAFWDVMDVSRDPVVATHSACRAVSPHRRNLTDEMMRAIADSGGVVQINFSAGFVDPGFPVIDPEVLKQWRAEGGAASRPLTDHVTPLTVLVDHFDHALQVIGPEHVGIGSDFDGVAALPAGMEDCSKLPGLTAELMRRGYGEADLTKMLGENVLRVMETCREAANAV